MSAVAATGADLSGGVVHKNGIDPEINCEQCEKGIDERTLGAA